MNTQTSHSEVRRETCATCFFCLGDTIPDPNAEHKPGLAKPKVAGHRCHVCRPTNGGFPIVRADQFCALWTDKATKEQPLVQLLRPFYGVTTTENGGEN